MPDMIQINRAVAQKIIGALQAAMGSKPAPAAQSSGGGGDDVLRFGQYKGQTYASVAETAEGRDWLTWAMDNACEKYPDTRARIEAALAGGEPPPAVDGLPPDDVFPPYDEEETPF